MRNKKKRHEDKANFKLLTQILSDLFNMLNKRNKDEPEDLEVKTFNYKGHYTFTSFKVKFIV